MTLLVLTLYVVTHNFQESAEEETPAVIVKKTKNEEELERLLKKYASWDNTIMLTFVNNMANLELALNLYESIQRIDLRYYLFVTDSEEVHHRLSTAGVNCFLYQKRGSRRKHRVPENASGTSPKGSFRQEHRVPENVRGKSGNRGFRQKHKVPEHVNKTSLRYTPCSAVTLYGTNAMEELLHKRSERILKILRLGYNVLNCDADVVLYRNPLNDIACTWLRRCDVIGQNPFGILLDPGFMYTRSCSSSILMYTRAVKFGRKRAAHGYPIPYADDVTAVNYAIRETRSVIHAYYLPHEKYMNGRMYYEEKRRQYGDDLEAVAARADLVAVHTNDIYSSCAKMYRLREALQWLYDGDDEYYSSTSRKYLKYNNTYSLKEMQMFNVTDSWQLESDALRSALAIGPVLNLTVILPRFHCPDVDNDTECTLLSHILLRHFEDKFYGAYRENMFLQHPKVPTSVRESLSPIYQIESAYSPLIDGMEVVQLTGNDAVRGASSLEIKRWFSVLDDISVLRFHSLYGAFKHFTNASQNARFNERFVEALVPGNYWQKPYVTETGYIV